MSAPDEPVPMLLWCPACGARHVDEGEFATRPHHAHACQRCGMVWRPALQTTVGVQFLPGFKSQEPVVSHPHVDDSGPVAYVRGTRVPVRRLLWWHYKGVPVKTIVKRYESIGWARLLDALSYAYDNHDRMTRELSRLSEDDLDPPVFEGGT